MLKKGKRIFAPKAVRRAASTRLASEAQVQSPLASAHSTKPSAPSKFARSDHAITSGDDRAVEKVILEVASGPLTTPPSGNDGTTASSHPSNEPNSVSPALIQSSRSRHGLSEVSASHERDSREQAGPAQVVSRLSESTSTHSNHEPSYPDQGSTILEPHSHTSSATSQRHAAQDAVTSGICLGAHTNGDADTQQNLVVVPHTANGVAISHSEGGSSDQITPGSSAVTSINAPNKSRPSRQRRAPRDRAAQAGVQADSTIPIDVVSTNGPVTRRSQRRLNQSRDVDEVRVSVEKVSENPDRSKPSRKRKSKSKDIGGAATHNGQVGENAEIGGGAEQAYKKRQRRSPTPSDAENEVIDPTTLKISALCDDLRIGKKFSKHDELRQRHARKRQQAVWARKHPELATLSTDQERPVQSGREHTAEITPQPINNRGIQMRMVNGQIVLDDASMRVDRQQDAAAEGIVFEEVEEDDFSHLTTAGTFLKRERNIKWTTHEEVIFYKGLRQFGTDFEMIAKMFPYRTRRQIKHHFTSEERKNVLKIRNALMGVKEDIDMEGYISLTGLKYDEVADIEAERRKIDEDHKAMEEAEEAELAEQVRKKKETIREKSEAARMARAKASNVALGSDDENESERVEGSGDDAEAVDEDLGDEVAEEPAADIDVEAEAEGEGETEGGNSVPTES